MTPTLTAGAFREVLHLQTETRVDLGGGSSTTAFADQATLRGRVRVLKGREHLQARQTTGAGSYEVTVRAPLPSGASLTSASRFVWESPTGDRLLEMSEPPRPDPYGLVFTMLCAEREIATA